MGGEHGAPYPKVAGTLADLIARGTCRPGPQTRRRRAPGPLRRARDRSRPRVVAGRYPDHLRPLGIPVARRAVPLSTGRRGGDRRPGLFLHGRAAASHGRAGVGDPRRPRGGNRSRRAGIRSSPRVPGRGHRRARSQQPVLPNGPDGPRARSDSVSAWAWFPERCSPPTRPTRTPSVSTPPSSPRESSARRSNWARP